MKKVKLIPNRCEPCKAPIAIETGKCVRCGTKYEVVGEKLVNA